MQSGLADKTVLVTGASGGIGRAVARVLADEGARLVLVGHSRSDELRAIADERGWSEHALVVRADVRRPEEVEAAFAAGLERFGRIDACVANAGVWPPGDHPLHELAEERVRDVVETNLLGAVWTARSFLRALARTGPRDDGDGAALVLTGSTAGRFGERGHADYAIGKAGLQGLVRTLKNEIVALDPYGRVNLVDPGWTVTEMARPALEDPAAVKRVAQTMALRQLARAEDVAQAILFLASPRLARHVTGEALMVAGGMEGRLLWDADEVDYEEIRARLGR